MRNLAAFGLCISLLIFGGLACKKGPFAKRSKPYMCAMEGVGEPKTSDEFYRRAQKHLAEKPGSIYDECAFEDVSEAVELDPQNGDALGFRGFLFYGKQDYDSALPDLTEAIRLKPGNPVFYGIRSSVYEKKNMLDQAIEDLSFVIGKEESHQDLARRGSLYFKKDDFENALKDYTAAIRLKPDFENHYTMRAEVYRKLGRNELAEADELKAKEFEDADAGQSGPTDSPTTGGSAPKTISGGVLNGKATNLVKPPYPPAARAVRASGAVNVQVTVDEKGNVTTANAVSGHPLLRAAAVAAARQSKFSPTLFGGNPVKVTGVLVYNFTPE
jgi:TonB family protein